MTSVRPLQIQYTGPRATPWTTVLERLMGELSGGYNFGTPRVVSRSDESVTVTVDAVKRGDGI
jgi:hypothetical protein